MIAFLCRKFAEYNTFCAEIHPVIYRLIILLSSSFFLFMLVFSRSKNIALPWEFYLIVPITLLYIYRGTLPLVRFLLLPVLLFFAYRFASAIVGEASNIRIEAIIELEGQLFAMIPTLTLQSILYVPGHFQWINMFAAFIYFLQLPLPFVVGLYLFLRRRRVVLERYLLALVILSLMGYATYLLFPAMPPWLASYYGFLPPVQRILLDVFQSMGWGFVNQFYSDFNHHPVAAVPSMHMSLTLLPMLYLILNGRWWIKVAAVTFTFLMLFSIVYLGEHYVFDALIGMFYAVIAYYLTELVFLLIKTEQPITPKPIDRHRLAH